MSELKRLFYNFAPTALALTAMLTASEATVCASPSVSNLEKTATAQYQKSDFKDCLKTLKSAFKILPQSQTNQSTQHARLLKLQGDCCYQNEKYGQAIELYSAAATEFESTQPLDAIAFKDCLNALAGSYVHQRNFEKAAPVYEKLVLQTETTCGANQKLSSSHGSRYERQTGQTRLICRYLQ